MEDLIERQAAKDPDMTSPKKLSDLLMTRQQAFPTDSSLEELQLLASDAIALPSNSVPQTVTLTTTQSLTDMDGVANQAVEGEQIALLPQVITSSGLDATAAGTRLTNMSAIDLSEAEFTVVNPSDATPLEGIISNPQDYVIIVETVQN